MSSTRRTRSNGENPDEIGDLTGLRNWAGNVRFGAARLLEPGSVDELQERIRAGGSLRVLGSAHSFNDIADTTGDLVSLARLPRVFEIDAANRSVTVDGAVRYGEICGPLDAAGFALHAMASLPHISVAGACATGTHGSGDHSGNLATAVSALEVVTGQGERRSFVRGDPAFAGAVVALGALGAVVSVTLDVEPAYQMRQDVYLDLPLESVVDRFDEITTAADSVSLFTEWKGPQIDQVWLKRRVREGDAWEPPVALHGARRATVPMHPIRGFAPDACTPQLGVVGPWHERLPHFRFDHTPSAGDELQSEYLVPREHAAAALSAVHAIRDRVSPLLQVSEVRSIAADDLWLSPSCGRESVAIHFTWLPDVEGVAGLLPVLEAALEPYEPRPHWGKLFAMTGATLAERYPRMPEFIGLARELDPRGIFRNEYLDRVIFGTA